MRLLAAHIQKFGLVSENENRARDVDGLALAVKTFEKVAGFYSDAGAKRSQERSDPKQSENDNERATCLKNRSFSPLSLCEGGRPNAVLRKK